MARDVNWLVRESLRGLLGEARQAGKGDCEDNDDEWRAEGRAKNTRLDFLNQNGVDTYSKSERKGPKLP